jgi:hypothetical protein
MTLDVALPLPIPDMIRVLESSGPVVRAVTRAIDANNGDLWFLSFYWDDFNQAHSATHRLSARRGYFATLTQTWHLSAGVSFRYMAKFYDEHDAY